MDNIKVFNLLHFAKKSGTLKIGFQEVVRVVKSKKAKIVLIANDLSANTLEKMKSLRQENPSLFYHFSNMEEISQQLNIRKTGILCLTDENISKGISQLLGYEWRNNVNTRS
jgi:ribosomal protein L7Ae-like RNA K-turn-binding protein